jgi:hypothetical protein
MDVVNKYYSICMVNLMLKYSCEEAIYCDTDGFAVYVEGFDPDFIVTGNSTVNVFDAQAALIVLDNLTFVFGDFRVDENLE